MILTTIGWTEVDIQRIVRMVLVRIIGRMIVGNPACRTPEWLDLGEHFTEDFVEASIIMRLVPSWLHFLVTNIIPQRWRLKRRLRETTNIVAPVIARHEEAVRSRSQGMEIEEENTMMNWMLDNEEDQNYVLANMAKLVLIILVPAAHTSAMAISNMLFDLCAHPEWDAKLRKEICDVTDELGKVGERTPVKEWNTRLELLDSFFMESQRLSQPLSSKPTALSFKALYLLRVVTPNRFATESFTFKDGLHIPKGSLLGWISIHNQIDPEVTPEPEVFDPMRCYRKRYSSPDEESKHLAGQPALDSLTFGFGSQACPGRYIAVNVIKMVVSRLLVDYEFKYAEGKAKPRSIHLLEFIFPDPASTLMMRKRQVV